MLTEFRRLPLKNVKLEAWVLNEKLVTSPLFIGSGIFLVDRPLLLVGWPVVCVPQVELWEVQNVAPCSLRPPPSSAKDVESQH